MTNKQSPFEKLDKIKMKRFEDIVDSKNINCNISTNGLYAPGQNIALSVKVNIKGTDSATTFSTSFNCTATTFALIMDLFLEWWDREVVRFNSFNELTKK